MKKYTRPMLYRKTVKFADEVLPLEPVELVEKWKSYWQDKIPKIIKKIEIA